MWERVCAVVCEGKHCHTEEATIKTISAAGSVVVYNYGEGECVLFMCT